MASHSLCTLIVPSRNKIEKGMWDCAWRGGHTYWNSCIAPLDSPSHARERSAIGGCITVSGRGKNWGRTVPLCGFTAGRSFADMQGTNPRTRPIGFQCLQTQNTPRANWGNCVTIYVRLFTHQIFSEDKKKYYNFSSHESKISLCILPSWDQTASPRCAQQPAQHSSLAASLISLASPK